MVPSVYTVKSNVRDLSDVVTITVAPLGGVVPAFCPGQFCMLYIPGVGEVPISISGSPSERAFLTFTIRDVGNVSRALTLLMVDDQIGLRGPFGTGWPVEQARQSDLLVIAGGLGLAPLRPVLYTVQENRDEYRKVILLYGTRSPETRLYEEEYRKWKDTGQIEMHRTVDVAPSGYRGRVGLVTRLIPAALEQLRKPVAMLCGPEVMMRFCAQELAGAGLEPSQVYLSLERNMKCAVGVCGRCQYGPEFICKDGPVLSYERIQRQLQIREL
jgi:NAD(P)H-flavin reductase